ncbi:DUF4389 domain-containing protein [Salibacteraceae bacterium]|nr:DUF4389 domain-containing protein [Salibacteraceae bacterium]
MIIDIKKQDSYSRGELLLRTLFGAFYILIPHAFLLLFIGLAALVVDFLAFWVILFTGRYPESWFEFRLNFMRWNLRLNASLFNLVDGYPKLGLKNQHEGVVLDVEYPTDISRSSVALRFLFGYIYVMIPHGFILSVLMVAVLFANLIGWWAVLLTGRYPDSLFNFQVYYFRWSQRVILYMAYSTHTYPPFHGDLDPDLANSNSLDSEI